MKKVLVAMDSFKGTLSSKELSELIKKHLPQKKMDLSLLPMSDGGEGFVEALTYSLDSKDQRLMVQDAFGEEKETKYALVNDHTAIMEIALSSGLSDIKLSKLNPFLTSTYGLGQTMIHALDQGAKQLVIGLGGSSTNDGGAGMLQALGVRFLDKNHQVIERMTGYSIGDVQAIDTTQMDSRLFKTEIIVASDVHNPLLGQEGASHVYGKQKGASHEMIKVLESNMKHFSELCIKTFHKDERQYPGTGAAGGLGFAFKSFLDAKLESGFKLVSKMVGLEQKIKEADIVITGEGQFDLQSYQGKVPVEIAKVAKKNQKEVIGLFGISLMDDLSELFDEFYTIVPEIASKEDALKDPQENFIKMIKKIKI